MDCAVSSEGYVFVEVFIPAVSKLGYLTPAPSIVTAPGIVMSVQSLLTNRIVRWGRVIDLHGYLVEPAGHAMGQFGEFALRARRPAPYGDPSVLLDVRELWLPGPDPDGLRQEAEGCHLQGSSWNAQIDGERPEDAERLDVDRSKPRRLIIHRHPYGQPNEVREPARRLAAPERWLQEVEEIVFQRYIILHDEEDEVD
jgi:hypothetical protein